MLKYFCHESEGLIYKIYQNEEGNFVIKIKKDGVTVLVHESDQSLTVAIIKAQLQYKQAVRAIEM